MADDLTKRPLFRKRGEKDETAPRRRNQRPEPNPEAGRLRELQSRAIDSIRDELSNYWLNYAFLDGSQWVVWSRDSGRIVEADREDSRARITVDRMSPNTRTVISKAMQRELTFEVLPNMSDDAHIRASRIGETLLRTLHTEQDWEVIREKHLQAMWKGGTAAICVDWDPNAKDQILPPSEEGAPAVFSGEAKLSVLSIAEMAVEPGASDPERARYWFKTQRIPPKEVQSMFRLDWEPEADTSSNAQPYTSRFSAGQTQHDSRTTLVVTYYERPNFLNQKGRLAVVVNDQIVHDVDWPFPYKDRLNLFVGRETVVEDRWTGTTILSRARGIQVAINAAHSSVIEHMKRAGNARLAVPQSSLDAINALTDQAAEVVPFNDGVSTPPQWISPPQMPSWWVEAPERLQIQIDDIMGVHDVSRGDTPANAPDSGYGISLLIEQDTTPVGRMVKETARVWSDVASFVLALYESQTKAKRKISVTLPDQPATTIEWTGKDLLGQHTAFVPPDSLIPRSRAAQMAMAEKMMAMGVISSAAEFAAVAELPGAKDMLSRIAPDIQRARRENAIMGAGKVAVVRDFDDHAAHIMEHNNFRKSAFYEMLSPEEQSIVGKHVKGHELAAAEQLGRRSAGAAISPALAGMPMADGSPAMDPAMLAGPEPVAPELPPVEETPPLDENALVEQMLAEMQVANPTDNDNPLPE